MTRRRRRKLDPVTERRRRLVFQSLGLGLLVIVALPLVILALRMP